MSHSVPMLVAEPANDSDGDNTETPDQLEVAPLPGEHWNPTKHTIALPTDSYGCIDFRGGAQTNKAQVAHFSRQFNLCCCYGVRMRPQILKTWDQSFVTVLFKHYVSSVF
jgi:hypothetical protein